MEGGKKGQALGGDIEVYLVRLLNSRDCIYLEDRW